MEDEAFDYLIQGVGRKELNEYNYAPALDNIIMCRGGDSIMW